MGDAEFSEVVEAGDEVAVMAWTMGGYTSAILCLGFLHGTRSVRSAKVACRLKPCWENLLRMVR